MLRKLNAVSAHGGWPCHLAVSPKGQSVIQYELDGSGRLRERKGVTKVAPGSGPRHFALHTSGKFGYLLNELLRTKILACLPNRVG